jgi:hypothetical protein
MRFNRDNALAACTLSATDHAARVAWIQQLNDAALVAVHRCRRRIELSYRPEAADRARELIRREQLCCPFLKFSFQEGRLAVTVAIEVPSRLEDVAEELFEPYGRRKEDDARSDERQ